MSEDVVQLILSQHLRVPGDVVEGEVTVNFRSMQHYSFERIGVRLLGAVFTRVARAVGFAQNETKQTVLLADESTTLWRQGETYPTPDSDILKLPFRFVLPIQDILPSCHFDNKLDLSGKIIYWVEVLGKRSSLHYNKRISQPFPVLPSNSTGAELSHLIRAGWTGPWRGIVETKQIRKGMWGGHATAKWTLTLPHTEFYPILTPIPFTLNIVTLSKNMKHDDIPSSGVIFPAPPHTPFHGIDLKIMRNVWIKANHEDGENFGTFVDNLGGFGPEDNAESRVQIKVKENVWIPDADGKDQGFWKQEVSFSSTFTVQCAPTFQSSTMTVNYNLQLTVEFPGVGNNIRGLIPVCFVSNIPPSGSRTLQGPLSELDLPPSYFSSTHADFGGIDGDAKAYDS